MRNFAVGLTLVALSIVAGAAWADPSVIIVGGGAAGLESAELLREAGISHLLLESGARGGGRLTSRSIGDGLVIDEGATLINSNDETVIERLKQFGIPYIRRFSAGEDGMSFLIQGKIYSQAEANRLLFKTNGRALWRIAFDAKNPREDYFTDTSILKYLDDVDADPILEQLLESFFWSEYGHTLGNLNVHVLHDYFSVDVEKKSFHLIPNYDEAYTVPGGSGQLTSIMAERNRDSILYNRKVTHVEQLENGKMRVTTSDSEVFEADYVIYAAPIRTLGNEVSVNVQGISQELVTEAAKVNYAAGQKFHLKFRAPFRERYKFGGILTTDTGDQIWTSSQGQPGDFGLLTVLTGPVPKEMRDAHVEHILEQVELFQPGTRELFMEYHHSDAPFSYSGAMKPGEKKIIRINSLENTPFFIPVGEASGEGFQGYLEGAFRSSRIKTRLLIDRLKNSLSICELHAI